MVRVETIALLTKAGMGVLPDAEVARAAGLSRQRVWAVRESLDLPRVDGTRLADVQRLEVIRKSGARTQKEAAEAIGESVLVVREALKRLKVDLGLRGPRGPRPGSRGVRITSTRRVLTAARKSKTMADLARRLGMAPGNLRTFLDRHGLAEEIRDIVKPVRRREYQFKRSPEDVFAAVKGARSYREVADRLKMHPSYLRPVLGRLGIMEKVDAMMESNLQPKQPGQSGKSRK